MKSTGYCPDNDCYAILGLKQSDFNDNSIKKQYKRLCLQLHPDKQPIQARDEAHVAFVRMQNAFEILADSSERRKYNKRRNSYYKDLFKNTVQFVQRVDLLVWMNVVQEPVILSQEKERARLQFARWSRFGDCERAKADEEQKRRDEQRQQHEENNNKKKEEKHAKQELEVQQLQEDAKSMAIDYSKWEFRQKEERKSEVEGREAEKRKQTEQHMNDENDLLNVKRRIAKRNCKKFSGAKRRNGRH